MMNKTISICKNYASFGLGMSQLEPNLKLDDIIDRANLKCDDDAGSYGLMLVR